MQVRARQWLHHKLQMIIFLILLQLYISLLLFDLDQNFLWSPSCLRTCSIWIIFDCSTLAGPCAGRPRDGEDLIIRSFKRQWKHSFYVHSPNIYTYSYFYYSKCSISSQISVERILHASIFWTTSWQNVLPYSLMCRIDCRSLLEPADLSTYNTKGLHCL